MSWLISKLNENNFLYCNSLEVINKTQIYLNKQNSTKWNNRIENDFYQEINQRKSCSKKLNKCVSTFDYINKILIVLSATSGGISIISFTSIVGAPSGIETASFTLIFSLTPGILLKLLIITYY